MHPSFPYWFTETLKPTSLILPCPFLSSLSVSLIAVCASVSLSKPGIEGREITRWRVGSVDHGGGRDGRNAIIVSAVPELDAMPVAGEIFSVLKKIGACKVAETLFDTAARAGYLPTFPCPCLSPVECLSCQKYALAESSTIANFLSELLLLGLRK